MDGRYASLGEMERHIISKSAIIIDPIYPGEILESAFRKPLGLSAKESVDLTMEKQK
ncbi:MAG: hypothetical protein ACR2QW_09110 [bacterium]